MVDDSLGSPRCRREEREGACAHAVNWVRSEGHDYRGQSASYLYVCGYGPSVCPPSGYGGCGYADSALRGTEAESATTWGREGDGFVVRFYLR